MTGTVDPCPHVCAACGSCPDCCPERHKIQAILGVSSGHDKSNLIAAKLAELAWQGRENFSGRLLSDGTEIWRTIPSHMPVAWKALLEQSAPGDQPTP